MIKLNQIKTAICYFLQYLFPKVTVNIITAIIIAIIINIK